MFLLSRHFIERFSWCREHDSDFREIVTNSGPIRHNWKIEKFRIVGGKHPVGFLYSAEKVLLQ